MVREYVCEHATRQESGLKMGQRVVGSKPRLQTCIYYSSARDARWDEPHNERRDAAPPPPAFPPRPPFLRAHRCVLAPGRQHRPALCPVHTIRIKRDLSSSAIICAILARLDDQYVHDVCATVQAATRRRRARGREKHRSERESVNCRVTKSVDAINRGRVGARWKKQSPLVGAQ